MAARKLERVIIVIILLVQNSYCYDHIGPRNSALTGQDLEAADDEDEDRDLTEAGEGRIFFTSSTLTVTNSTLIRLVGLIVGSLLVTLPIILALQSVLGGDSGGGYGGGGGGGYAAPSSSYGGHASASRHRKRRRRKNRKRKRKHDPNPDPDLDRQRSFAKSAAGPVSITSSEEEDILSESLFSLRTFSRIFSAFNSSIKY